MEKRDQRILEILDILRSHPEPMSSTAISGYLQDEGFDISERTVRHYLLMMDKEGFTENHGKKGRVITAAGRTEVEGYKTIERVGFLSAKIDQMTYAMNFDLDRREGTLIVNTIIVKPADFKKCVHKICDVFKYGYAMGHLVALHAPGEASGNTRVPDGCIGISTVCSVTLNGVLLKHGVPMHSRFGGMLELVDGKPRGFSEIINYDGTTVDPLEVFIRSGMTNYLGAISSGTGRIGASFREIPGDSRPLALDLARKLDRIGLGGIYEIARAGRPLFGVPVSQGRAGMVLIGGLNPASIFAENHIPVLTYALSGLMEFNRLEHYEVLRRAAKNL